MGQIEEKEKDGDDGEGQEDALEKDGQDGLDEVGVRQEVDDTADRVQPGSAGGGLLSDGLGMAHLLFDRVLDRHDGIDG